MKFAKFLSSLVIFLRSRLFPLSDEARGFVCRRDAVVLLSANRSSRRKGAAHVQKEILELLVKLEVQ